MSMLNNLKKTQKSTVFLDDDDNIDDMDFELPTDNGPMGMPGMPAGMPDMNAIQNMMKSMQGGAAGPSRATTTQSASNIAVAHTPQGIQRLDPSVYKE